MGGGGEVLHKCLSHGFEMKSLSQPVQSIKNLALSKYFYRTVNAEQLFN